MAKNVMELYSRAELLFTKVQESSKVEQDDLEDAFSTISQALELAPNNKKVQVLHRRILNNLVEFLYTQAEGLVTRGDMETADQIVTRGLILNSRHAGLKGLHTKILAAKSRREGKSGVENARRAVLSDPKNLVLYERLIMALMHRGKKGDFKAADEWLDKQKAKARDFIKSGKTDKVPADILKDPAGYFKAKRKAINDVRQKRITEAVAEQKKRKAAKTKK
ncbi:MAG: hypothetical protein ABIG20_03820 [archaeon]